MCHRCTSHFAPTIARRLTRFTRPRWPRVAATMARPASGRTTTPTTTEPSCWIRTGTTSRPSATDRLAEFGRLMRVFDFNSAIVRTPGKSVVNGLRATPGPAPVFETVLAEHQAHISALRAAGLEVTVLPSLEQFPDSVFVEDPALVFTQAAVLLRPGAPSRMAEARELTSTLTARFPAVLQLSEGFADGGDILVTPNRVLIGLSTRTNELGAAVLLGLLESIGLTGKVVIVPRGTLHLKSDCSLIDEETMLATEELKDSGLLEGYRVLVAPNDERHA